MGDGLGSHGELGFMVLGKMVERIDTQVMSAITVLAYDVLVARVYGEIEAEMHRRRTPLADADLQIAATALHHGLELVTGNVRRFLRIPGLSISPVLADARRM